MKNRNLHLILLGASLWALASCTSKSTPVEPNGNGGGGGTVPPQATVTVSVSASPSALAPDSTVPSTITVFASRSDGQPLQAGSQAILTTTLGSFGSVGGPTTITLDLVNGRAQTTLFPSGVAGTATIRAGILINGSEAGFGIANVTVSASVTAYSMSVSANPSSLSANSDSSSAVRVSATRSDHQPFPVGTQVVLSSNLGSFGSPGGPSTITLDLINGRAQTVFFPGTSQGTAQLRAGLTINNVEVAVAVANVNISPSAGFFINGVSPNTGSPQGGETVNILGGGFTAPVRVTFNGVAATILSVTPTQITVKTPPLTPLPANFTSQAVNVVVINKVNSATQATDTLPSGFVYTNGGGGLQPQIFSVTPATGPNSGNTQVVINGDGFASDVQVFFQTQDGATALEASVLSVTRTQITVLSPAAQGFGNVFQNSAVSIRVVNRSTGLAATSVGAFRYGARVIITSISPGEGSFVGGTRVTIFGQGFQDPVAVGLGGVGQQPLNVSGTEIVVITVPVQINNCVEPSGAAQVTNINTGDSGTGPVFTYRVPKPFISSVSPGSGPQGGNTTVTITGFNFESPESVLFGTAAGTVTAVNPPNLSPNSLSTPGTITARTPPFTGTFATTACTSGTLTGTMNIPAPVDVVVNDPRTGCTTTFVQGFSYIPSDQTCHVTLPSAPSAEFTAGDADAATTGIQCAGLDCNFLDQSTGSPTSWSWNFGDPGSGGSNLSSAQNPPHTFSGNGLFTVQLTVTNAGGSGSKAHTVNCASSVCTFNP